MARLPKQQLGEIRDGLVLYPGGQTWHYEVKWRGKKRNGDTKCETRSAAVEWLEREKERWRAQEQGRTLPTDQIPSLIRLLGMFLAENRGVLSDKHLDVVECKVRLNMKALHHVRVDQLSNELVATMRKDYMAGGKRIPGAKVDRPRSAGGANSLVKTLSGLIGWALERKIIGVRPFKLERLKEDRKPRQVLGFPSAQAFLAVIDQSRNPHVRLAVRMMLMLGLRENEALKARWEWVNWDHAQYNAGSTKSGDPRIIDIPKWFLAYLKALKPASGSGLMMPDTRPRKGDPEKVRKQKVAGLVPHEAQFTKKSIARAATKLKLHGLTPHRLRATFATMHAKAGTNLKDIQDMLGHAEIETTMIYVESVKEGRAAAQAKVSEMMGLQRPLAKRGPKK